MKSCVNEKPTNTTQYINHHFCARGMSLVTEATGRWRKHVKNHNEETMRNIRILWYPVKHGHQSRNNANKQHTNHNANKQHTNTPRSLSSLTRGINGVTRPHQQTTHFRHKSGGHQKNHGQQYHVRSIAHHFSKHQSLFVGDNAKPHQHSKDKIGILYVGHDFANFDVATNQPFQQRQSNVCTVCQWHLQPQDKAATRCNKMQQDATTQKNKEWQS